MIQKIENLRDSLDRPNPGAVAAQLLSALKKEKFFAPRTEKIEKIHAAIQADHITLLNRIQAQVPPLLELYKKVQKHGMKETPTLEENEKERVRAMVQEVQGKLTGITFEPFKSLGERINFHLDAVIKLMDGNPAVSLMQGRPNKADLQKRLEVMKAAIFEREIAGKIYTSEFTALWNQIRDATHSPRRSMDLANSPRLPSFQKPPELFEPRCGRSREGPGGYRSCGADRRVLRS